MAGIRPLVLPLTVQAMFMSQDRAKAQGLVLITPRLSTIRLEMSSGLPATTGRGMALMRPVLLPLMAQEISMSQDLATAQAMVLITPRLSTIRLEMSSGLPATTGRGIVLMLPPLLPLTAQAILMSPDIAAV